MRFPAHFEFHEAYLIELSSSAYVVHKSGPSAAPHSFAQDVAKWVQSRVARHKFLRGGVVVIDVVPKSGAGKILRRQLRDRAKVEVNAAKEQTQTRAKL